MIQALRNMSIDTSIIDILRNSAKNNQTIFIAGNGGSAAIAQHLSCDLSKCTNQRTSNNHPFRVVCLNGNMSLITAIANDHGYEEVFSEQLSRLANEGDILILISSSGQSPNIRKAVDYALENNIMIIGFSGFEGGHLKAKSNHSIHINSSEYGIIEDIHSILGHYISKELQT